MGGEGRKYFGVPSPHLPASLSQGSNVFAALSQEQSEEEEEEERKGESSRPSKGKSNKVGVTWLPGSAEGGHPKNGVLC